MLEDIDYRYKDKEIMMKPWGIVYFGKKINGQKKTFNL